MSDLSLRPSRFWKALPRPGAGLYGLLMWGVLPLAQRNWLKVFKYCQTRPLPRAVVKLQHVYEFLKISNLENGVFDARHLTLMAWSENSPVQMKIISSWCFDEKKYSLFHYIVRAACAAPSSDREFLSMLLMPLVDLFGQLQDIRSRLDGKGLFLYSIKFGVVGNAMTFVHVLTTLNNPKDPVLAERAHLVNDILKVLREYSQGPGSNGVLYDLNTPILCLDAYLRAHMLSALIASRKHPAAYTKPYL